MQGAFDAVLEHKTVVPQAARSTCSSLEVTPPSRFSPPRGRPRTVIPTARRAGCAHKTKKETLHANPRPAAVRHLPRSKRPALLVVVLAGYHAPAAFAQTTFSTIGPHEYELPTSALQRLRPVRLRAGITKMTFNASGDKVKGTRQPDHRRHVQVRALLDA